MPLLRRLARPTDTKKNKILSTLIGKKEDQQSYLDDRTYYTLLQNLFIRPELLQLLNPIDRYRLSTITRAIRDDPSLVSTRTQIMPPGETAMKQTNLDPFPNIRKFTQSKTSGELLKSFTTSEGIRNLADIVRSDLDTFFLAHPHVLDPGAEYRTTQQFGARPEVYGKWGLAGHEGLDVAVKENTPLRAPFNGTIVIAGDPKSTPGWSNYGNWVRIKDDKTGEMYDLGHMNKVNVTEGTKVEKGQLLGITGNTGFSEGPHLHLSYWDSQGKRIDPRQSPLVQKWLTGEIKGITDISTKEVVEATHAPAGEVTKPADVTQPVSTQVVKETPDQYKNMIIEAAKKYDVPPMLLSAMLSKETTGFNPKVISGEIKSRAGAIGIAQFMPNTITELQRQNYNNGKAINPINPTEAIAAAAYYLKQQQNTFGNWELALAAYNAGPGRVRQFGDIPPITETQNYVRTIMNRLTEEQEITPTPTSQLLPTTQTSVLQRLYQPTKVYAAERQTIPTPGQIYTSRTSTYAPVSSSYMPTSTYMPSPTLTSMQKQVISSPTQWSSPAPSYSSPAPSVSIPTPSKAVTDWSWAQSKAPVTYRTPTPAPTPTYKAPVTDWSWAQSKAPWAK